MRPHSLSFALLVIIGLFSACSTTRMAAPDLEKTITDSEGTNTGGIVVYNPHGVKQLVEARRNQAFKRMRKVCDPLIFDITDEENDVPENRNPKYKDNITAVTGKTVRFIEFRCVEP